VRKTIYAAKSTKCFSLFEKMKQEDIDIAVILDEYGGIDGVISVERLMEQMMNTIQNSHDEEDNDGLLIQQINDNIYILDARTSIQKVEELFKDVEFLSEEEGEYETIGGFILSYLDRVPSKGETFSHVGGLEVEIIESTSRAIKKVKITGMNNLT
jgi:CBS domain containing-hemolysin-like protein